MMNINKMTREEIELAVFELKCKDCKECPLKEICGKHELFWDCAVWEQLVGEDL